MRGMRGALLALAATPVLVCCGDDSERAELHELRQRAEELKAGNDHLREREKALQEQLENEAAEKVEALRALEAARAENAPLQQKVEEAQQRVHEVEEMIKERKKLEPLD